MKKFIVIGGNGICYVMVIFGDGKGLDFEDFGVVESLRMKCCGEEVWMFVGVFVIFWMM